MNKQIDARGLNCPKPVIETKKALDTLTEGSVTTIVDNEVAMQNVKKLAESMAYDVDIKKVQEDFYIHMYKGKSTRDISYQSNEKRDLAIMLTHDRIGTGAVELGSILMKSYIYTLTEYRPYPKVLLFMNEGVKLTTEGSEVIEYLRKLESEGVEILSCGTCLDYFDLKTKLVVGGVSNMYTIVEKFHGAKNRITW